MGKLHTVKILEYFCDDLMSGKKSFEIRQNDRGYQTGDSISFTPVNNLGLPVDHPIKREVFDIKYVLSGWGLKSNYVCLAIKRREAD